FPRNQAAILAIIERSKLGQGQLRPWKAKLKCKIDSNVKKLVAITPLVDYWKYCFAIQVFRP
ncbi:MAG TPA: hypothetical protein ACN46T_08035, partial [Prochlorococcus sp.]